MTVKQRMVVLLGILCSTWTIGALLFVLFGPVYSTATGNSDGTQTTGTASLVQVGLSPLTAVIFGIIGGIALGVLLAAIFAARGSAVARTLLWILTFSFLPFVLLGIFSIGPLIFPGFLFAFVASLLARM
jgi:hypothetical protein